ncbi:hypothetical protein [Mesorhizobium muleiense]|jgi:hypothetical protein|uniref:hypothetical protein n=1 Tax=Mesorhizobium muleiense TaxID=1004279 RepID=UPI001F32BD0C|nr:hypothetical protein [Mesorhizobium muleiense]MCF6114863.1 hypothetical protein [Mesorhizobium muleiense]
MVDEVKAVLGTGKTIKIGNVDWIIVDDGVLPVVPSAFVEARHYDGLVYLSLAQTVIDEGNPPEVRVCTRMRMGLSFAQMMHAQLGRLISDALKPVDQSKAN